MTALDIEEFARDPRWLSWGGAFIEVVGVLLLISKAQGDPVGGRRATSSRRREAVRGSGARPKRPG